MKDPNFRDRIPSPVDGGLVLMNRKVIFCNCGAKLLGPSRATTISGYLNEAGHPFAEISDLCGISVDHKSATRNLLLSADEILIIACFPRAVKLLLENCGIDHQALKLSFINFREMNDSQVLDGVASFFASKTAPGASSAFQGSSQWPAWFPIIDHSRCNTCGQCADFCLFGVYEKIDGKVVVANPKECKNNCPACARICPQTAIIFPKYEHSGAIAGADAIDEISEQQRQQLDIDAILGSNIYQALALRKAKRQSIISSTAMRQALADRDKALSENASNS